MKYLHVGRSEITKERFRPVVDTEPKSIKPKGGIWLTKQNPEWTSYNEWVDFIIEHPTVLFYKSRNYSMWKQPCSLVTLKDNANIFNLDDGDKLKYLIKHYPLEGNKFSYVAISNIYDAIFVDLLKLLRTVDDSEMRSRLYKFAVDSLVLFNVDCIDYYQSGIVDITPFDLEYPSYEGTPYEIRIEDTKKKVLTK